MAYDAPRVRRVPPPPPPGFGDDEYYRLYGRPEDYHKYRQQLEEEYHDRRGSNPGPYPRPPQHPYDRHPGPRPGPEEYYHGRPYHRGARPEYFSDRRGLPRANRGRKGRPAEVILRDTAPDLSSLDEQEEEEEISPKTEPAKDRFENFRVTIRNESEGTPSLSGMDDDDDDTGVSNDDKSGDEGSESEDNSEESDSEAFSEESGGQKVRPKSIIYRQKPAESVILAPQQNRISVKDRLGTRKMTVPQRNVRRQDDRSAGAVLRREKSPAARQNRSPPIQNSRRQRQGSEERKEKDTATKGASSRPARSPRRERRRSPSGNRRQGSGSRNRGNANSQSKPSNRKKTNPPKSTESMTVQKMKDTHKENEIMLRRLKRKRQNQPRTSESDKNATLARLAGIEIPAETLGLHSNKPRRDSSQSKSSSRERPRARSWDRGKDRNPPKKQPVNNRDRDRSRDRDRNQRPAVRNGRKSPDRPRSPRPRDPKPQEKPRNDRNRDNGKNATKPIRNKRRTPSKTPPKSRNRNLSRSRSNSRGKSPDRSAVANAARKRLESRKTIKSPRRGGNRRRRSRDRVKVTGMESSALKSQRSRLLLSRSRSTSRSRPESAATAKSKKNVPTSGNGGGNSPDKWQHDKFQVGLLTPENGIDERAFGSHWSRIRSERSKERDRRSRSRSSSRSRRKGKKRKHGSSSGSRSRSRSRRKRSFSSGSSSSRSSSYSITSSSSGSVRRERRKHKAEKKAQMEAALAAGLPIELEPLLPNSSALQTGKEDGVNFGLTGKLMNDTNMVNGVIVKYSEPPEARKPKTKWRLYVFKGNEELPILYIHRQSAYLLGRDRKVADIPLDHPSCSKQHAALQYRLVEYTRDDGSRGKRVTPYVIDLESANGTFVNNQRIEARKYVQVLERDVLKFGFSSREYVLLHDQSKEIEGDDLGVE